MSIEFRMDHPYPILPAFEYYFPVMRGHKQDEWMRKLDERQQNTLFPDTARNLGGLCGGIYKQKLNRVQWVGLLILVVAYVFALIGTIFTTWPRGQGTFWAKLYYGYGPQLLISLPFLMFLLASHWWIRRSGSRR